MAEALEGILKSGECLRRYELFRWVRQVISPSHFRSPHLCRAGAVENKLLPFATGSSLIILFDSRYKLVGGLGSVGFADDWWMVWGSGMVRWSWDPLVGLTS